MADLTSGASAKIQLDPGQSLRVEAEGGTTNVTTLYGAPAGTTAVTGSTTFGPYSVPAMLRVVCASGACSYATVRDEPAANALTATQVTALQSVVSRYGNVGTWPLPGDTYRYAPGETIVDWATATASMAGSTNVTVKNSAYAYWGTTALDMTHQTNSGTLNASVTLAAPRAAFGSAPKLMIPLYVPDYTKVASIEVWLSTGGVTDYTRGFRSTPFQIGPSGRSHLRRSGWHVLVVGADEWTTQGLGDWATDTLDAIRVRFVGYGGAANLTTTLAIGDIRANTRAKAQIMLMTDRTYAAHYTVTRRLARALGLPLTHSVTQSDIGTAGKMTLAQLQQCVAEGDAVVPRAFAASSSMTPAAYVAAVQSEMGYLQANFGAVGAAGCRFLTYANGEYWPQGSARGDFSLVTQLQALGIVAARTTDTTGAPPPYCDLPLGTGIRPDANALMTLPIIGDTSGQTYTDITAKVDKAIAVGGAIVHFHHNPVEAAASWEGTPERLRALYEYVASKRAAGLIDVRTPMDFVDNL